MGSTKRIAALALLATMVIPVALAAKSTQNHKPQHHHYKLIDLGTFGGPQSWVFGWFEAEGTMSDGGTVFGGADTSAPNPNYPNYNPFMGLPQMVYFLNSDPFIEHAFQSKDGALIDLGVLPGGYNSFAQWISGNGTVVGASENGSIDPVTAWPEIRAVLWRNGQPKDLRTFGGYESSALGVNNRAHVVGFATDSANNARAFLWTENQGLQDLGTLGACCAIAGSINESDQVAGESATCDTCNQDVFFWEHGKMYHVPDFGGSISTHSALNNRGQVVGGSNLPGDLYGHAFVWDKKSGIRDLGLLPGGLSAGTRWINDAGQIVGLSGLDQDQLFHAVLWDHGITDLGTVDGDQCSVAEYINTEGQVVGGTFDCNTAGFLHAFLWESGRPMVDLNTLVPPNSDLLLIGALSINDRGEIAGQGLTSAGDNHPFLLIPCDENHPGVEGCDYSMVDASLAASVPAATVQPPHDEALGRISPAPPLLRGNRYRGPTFSGSNRAANYPLESATPSKPALYGYCAVDLSDHLTGECVGSANGLQCIDQYDKLQCPPGKRAIKPALFSCQPKQVTTVDAARFCPVCGGRCGFFGCGPGCACGKDGMCHRKAGGSLEEILWKPQL